MRLMAWGGWTPPLTNLFLPFPALKCLMVANSGEGHLGGLQEHVTTSKPARRSSQRLGQWRLRCWPYHGVQWDDGGRHEGVEEVVYMLPENEPC